MRDTSASGVGSGRASAGEVRFDGARCAATLMVSRPRVRSRKGLRPTRSGGPREAQGIAGEPGDGTDGLLELPWGDLGFASEGFEISPGGHLGGFVGYGFGPHSSPSDEVGAGSLGGGSPQEKLGEVSEWIPVEGVHLRVCWRMTKENASRICSEEYSSCFSSVVPFPGAEASPATYGLPGVADRRRGLR